MSDPNTDLNKHPGIVLWFDDLGSGNEEFRFLSNFYEGEPITVPGWTWENLFAACGVAAAPGILPGAEPPTGLIEFKTGEHAFAAMKFWGTDWTWFVDIVKAPDPSTAKKYGRSRSHPLRPDWEVVKLDVMAAVTRAKYTPEREESDRLLATGDKMLVEGTWWGDEVWGVALDVVGAPGRNWLGTILMARRAELRAMHAVGVVDFSYPGHFGAETVRHNASFSAEF